MVNAELPEKEVPVFVEEVIPTLSVAAVPRTKRGALTTNWLLIAMELALPLASKATPTLAANVAERVIAPLLFKIKG